MVALPSNELLFVGGNQDGKRHPVIDYAEKCYFVKGSSVPSLFSSIDTGAVPKLTTFEFETYNRVKFQGESKTFELMAIDELSVDDLIQRLIRNYIAIDWKD